MTKETKDALEKFFEEKNIKLIEKEIEKILFERKKKRIKYVSDENVTSGIK